MRKIFAVSLLMLSAFAFGCGDEEVTTINIYGHEDFVYDDLISQYVYVVSADEEEFEVEYNDNNYYIIISSNSGVLRFESAGTYKFELLRDEEEMDPYAYVWTTPNTYDSSDTTSLLDKEGQSVNVKVTAGDDVKISLGFRGPYAHSEDSECTIKVSKVQ